MLLNDTKSKKVGIVDTGVSNIGAISNMMRKIGIDYSFVNSPEQMDSCDFLILPGVGSYDIVMRKIRELNLYDALIEFSHSGRCLVGICLGMQMLFEGSEEGVEPGLGLIRTKLKRFKRSDAYKTTNMGWRNVNILNDIDIGVVEEDVRFYFAHSFYADINECGENMIMLSNNNFDFVCGVKVNNTYGFQFHPEKSHVFGMNLFRYIFKALL